VLSVVKAVAVAVAVRRYIRAIRVNPWLKPLPLPLHPCYPRESVVKAVAVRRCRSPFAVTSVLSVLSVVNAVVVAVAVAVAVRRYIRAIRAIRG
jgi:hypothetical protein